MTDIQKMIEEEAKKNAQFADVFAYIGYFQSYLRSVEIDQFKAGANFALSQLQHANRWRKVSEELPKVRKEPYQIAVRVVNIPTSTSIWNIRDEDDLKVFDNLRGCEWKPIE